MLQNKSALVANATSIFLTFGFAFICLFGKLVFETKAPPSENLRLSLPTAGFDPLKLIEFSNRDRFSENSVVAYLWGLQTGEQLQRSKALKA